MPDSIGRWWDRHRSSTRVAFMFQMATRVGSSILSLLWTPLLIGTMGKTLYGTFLTFQSVATLGALGDLGMGGAVQIETGRLLGRKEESLLQKFLAVARTAFFVLAICVTVLFVALAPWLPRWLAFEEPAGAGSIPLLFAIGGLGAGLLIVSGYIANLNYGAVNLTWPIIPAFALAQLGIAGHWLLALTGAPLWGQYVPYVAATAIAIACGWVFIRRSHRNLAAVVPVAFDGPTFREIVAKSIWVYVYCIGGTVYVVTDRLFINAGFGAAQVPSYQLNFKLCELALFVIASASLVSMPKITTWIASSDAQMRERGARETERLGRFQTFLGCAAALVYVAVNDTFMRLWLGGEYQVPLAWQGAFAANMAVTAAGYAGYDLAARCGPEGLRFGAITVVIAIVFKVAASYWAMVENSIFGIALSTIISQSIVVLASAWFAAKAIRVSWWRLVGNGWLISLGLVVFAVFWKASLWSHGVYGKAGFFMTALLLLAATAKILGLNAAEIRTEFDAVRSIFRKSGLARPDVTR